MYTPETIPDSEEQVVEDTAGAIRIPDYEMRLPKLKRRATGLASGIQKTIYRRPNCRSVESLKAGNPRTVAEIYRQIKGMPPKPIHSNLIRLEEGEKLYLASRPHFLYREKHDPNLQIFGFGRAFLTDRRLALQGRLKGRGNVRVSIPLEDIDAITVEPGDKLHFMAHNVLYRIPIRRESPLKWHDYLRQLSQLRRESPAQAPF